jgi:hypothetical protein
MALKDPTRNSSDSSPKATPDSESARRASLYGSKPKDGDPDGHPDIGPDIGPDIDPDIDPDGVRTVAKRQSSNAPLWAAVGLVVVGLGITVSGTFGPKRPIDPASVSRAPATEAEPYSSAPPNAPTKPRVKVPRATPIAKPTVMAAKPPKREDAVNTSASSSFVPAPMPDDPAAAPEPEEQPQDGSKPIIRAGAYIEALRAKGETKGIAAFNPPGTNPPKSGIIVPDDYELPPGYVRHYQTTDDGEQLSPILTLAPGYELLDDDGQPIELPPGRVLPPEFVPPDLPQEVLEVPEPKVRH